MTAGMAVLAVAPDPLQPSGAAANTAIPTLKQQIYARAGRDDYEQWITQVTPVGGCTKPVRLRGQLVDLDSRTGEITRQLNTGSELPDGVVYKACGSRRASQCPACAEVYRRDAFFLLQAGLVGGDGGPDTASRHPCIFATLTAPGFGPVHTRRTRGERVLPCRPRRRRDGTCRHGVLCLVRASTATTTRCSVSRSVCGASTTRPRWCGTFTPANCGGAPPKR